MCYTYFLSLYDAANAQFSESRSRPLDLLDSQRETAVQNRNVSLFLCVAWHVRPTLLYDGAVSYHGNHGCQWQQQIVLLTASALLGRNE